jgi:hypothetical protein
MVMDQSQLTGPPAPSDPSNSQPAAPRQAVAGLTPPQVGEAVIREAWPTVLNASPAAAALGQKLIRSVFLAPLGWLLLAPLYFKKIMPFLARRYTITNRRVMIRRGLKPSPTHEVALADIEDVRLAAGSLDEFYKSGTLEVIAKGQVALTLTGVPEPEGFRRALLNACAAWVPGKGKIVGAFIPASATK